MVRVSLLPLDLRVLVLLPEIVFHYFLEVVRS
jgi:hypothetical protein